jgi:hypothetical protein
MKKLLTNSTSYLLSPGHDLFYQDACGWTSTLSFYKIELDFLLKLLDNAFLESLTKSEQNEVEEFHMKLKNIQKKSLSLLMKKVLVHEESLGQLEEKQFSSLGEKKFLETHSTLKQEVTAFSSDVMALKREIFKLVEKKMKRNKKIDGEYVSGSLAL